MIKYSDDKRRLVLEAFRTRGINAASEEFRIPKNTIYRWNAAEQEKAKSIVAGAEDTPVIPTAPKTNDADAVLSDQKALPVEPAIEKDEQEKPEMIDLLMTENQKLRKRNYQLRLALQTLLE